MTTIDDLNEPDRQFLMRLFEQTGGDPSRQLSMYDVGKGLGWEREEASRVAQDLMADGYVEIRTLSGGVGLSSAGAEAVRSALGPSGPGAALPRLGAGRTLDAPACRAVTDVCDGIKAQAGKLGLGFDSLAELVADLKTVSEQLNSPRPKTAIVRECLRSIEALLKPVEKRLDLVGIRYLIDN